MSKSMENGLKLVVHHTMPSLNRLFSMGHWQRRKEKLSTQAAFASALKATGLDSATQTTFAQNTSLTASGMRASSRTTRRNSSRSKSRKRNANAKKQEQ